MHIAELSFALTRGAGGFGVKIAVTGEKVELRSLINDLGN